MKKKKKITTATEKCAHEERKQLSMSLSRCFLHHIINRLSSSFKIVRCSFALRKFLITLVFQSGSFFLLLFLIRDFLFFRFGCIKFEICQPEQSDKILNNFENETIRCRENSMYSQMISLTTRHHIFI